MLVVGAVVFSQLLHASSSHRRMPSSRDRYFRPVVEVPHSRALTYDRTSWHKLAHDGTGAFTKCCGSIICVQMCRGSTKQCWTLLDKKCAQRRPSCLSTCTVLSLLLLLLLLNRYWLKNHWNNYNCGTRRTNTDISDDCRQWISGRLSCRQASQAFTAPSINRNKTVVYIQ